MPIRNNTPTIKDIITMEANAVNKTNDINEKISSKLHEIDSSTLKNIET